MKLFAALSAACSIMAAQPQFSVDSLSWLAGEWELERDGVHTEEVWLAPSGNMMMGMSRTVRKMKTTEYEFLTIGQDSSGTVFYHARPSGQPEALFRLVSAGEKNVVFENQQHDFPQRIIYRRISGDSLIARIEGVRNGSVRWIDFLYGKKPR